MSTSSRGASRERLLRRRLEEGGWVVVRAAGSLGEVDLVVMKDGYRPRFVQVKSDERGPYNNFGPEKRHEFSAYARRAGAAAFLVWWPPHGVVKWIPESEFPS